MQTIAVGLDAFEWWYAEQLLQAGRLPNLSALIERGTSCRLANHLPYRSEFAWARFLTGNDPRKERTWPAGVVFDPDDYAARATGVRAATPFYAGRPGPVVAFDVIHSAIVDDVDGDQIVGWGSHAALHPRSASPTGLMREIDERFGASPALGNEHTFGWYDERYLAKLEAALVAATGIRAEAARWLMERRPGWRLFLTSMSEIPSGGHVYWHGADPAHLAHGVLTSDRAGAAMATVCEAADRALGRMIEGLDEANIVVFAMHGMAPADDVAASVLLPDLLFRRSHGRSLLCGLEDVESWRRRGCPPIAPPRGQRWDVWMRGHFADGRRDQVVAYLHRTLPPRVIGAVRRLFGRADEPVDAFNRVPPEEEPVNADTLAEHEGPMDYPLPSWYRSHWPSMRAFALPSFADGHVRINLEGRERGGIVPREDYEREVGDLIRVLEACRSVRTGAPAVEEVISLRRDDPMEPGGPPADLLVIWRDGPDAIEHPELGVVGPIPSLRTGSHTPNGFCVITGPDVPHHDAGTRSVDDLTATVMGLAGYDPTWAQIGTPIVAPATVDSG